MAFASAAIDCAASLLAWPVGRYIAAQRDQLAVSAMALTRPLRLLLRPYFSDADLEGVRVLQSDPWPITNPPFYALLRRLWMDFPEPRLVAAVTFDNVIASREAMSLQLLFHELVHVIQFRVLGIRTFAQLYVRGFLQRRSYDLIPLEVLAFELEQRFATEMKPFNVEDQVFEWARRDLF